MAQQHPSRNIPKTALAGLVPAIHRREDAWTPGTSPREGDWENVEAE